MIKIREQFAPAYKDQIENWVKYEKSRTPEEKLYWNSIWDQLDKTYICKVLDMSLYTVSGAQVRGLPKDIVPVDLDFCLGGTWARYPWILDGVIAIEYKLFKCYNYKEIVDRNAIIIHETTEVTEGLLKGLDYEDAHENFANKEESRYRFDPKSSKYYPLLLDIGLENPALTEDYNYANNQIFKDALKLAITRGFVIDSNRGIYEVYERKGYHKGNPIFTAKSLGELQGFLKR